MNKLEYHSIYHEDDKTTLRIILGEIAPLRNKIEDLLPNNYEQDIAIERLTEAFLWCKFSLACERGINDELQAETKRPPKPN